MTPIKTTSSTKDELRTDFITAAMGTFQALESQFAIEGVVEQVFGTNTDPRKINLVFRLSPAWRTLSTLYEYAVNGVDKCPDGASSTIIDGADVLQLASSEEYRPSAEWEAIVWMADGRHSLDDGSPVILEKLALLAKVDIRTVRNAISAGDLVALKIKGNTAREQIHIDNASARRWLLGRKGFKPTVLKHEDQTLSLGNVTTPSDFAAFLVAQRAVIDRNGAAEKLVVFHPNVTGNALNEIEAGVFNMPLDAVFPIADFYQVSRKELLDCVMRVFFAEQLSLLSEPTAYQEPSK